jgi:hypothetical protein
MRSSEAAMGGGGAQRPVFRGNELKKTVARSARARTRGQNPLVVIIAAFGDFFIDNIDISMNSFFLFFLQQI